MTWRVLLILASAGLASASSFKTHLGTYGVSEAEPVGIVTQGDRVWSTPVITPETKRIAGMVLCQNALAERILIIGNGLGLAQTMLLSEAVQDVTWAHPDPNFMRAFLDHALLKPRRTDARLILHTGPVTPLLESRAQAYDIIVVNLPDPLLPVCRDMVSPAFYSRVRRALTPLGLAVFSGPPADTPPLPQHVTFFGAMQYRRLEAEFLQTLLVPGQPMFLLCSQVNYMTTYAPRLEARFSLLDQSQDILPREHLETIYTPNGPAQLRAQLDTVDPNTPFSMDLYQLLRLAHAVRLPLLPALPSIRRTGPWCLGLMALIAAAVRLLYVTTCRSRRRTHTPDDPALYGTGMAVGIMGCAGTLLWMSAHLLAARPPGMPWAHAIWVLSLALIVSLSLLVQTYRGCSRARWKILICTLAPAWAAGYGVTRFVLLPMFDSQVILWTVGLFSLACLAGLAAQRMRATRPEPLLTNHALYTPLGYTLFALGASAVLVTHVMDTLNRPTLEPSAIQSVPQWTDGRIVTLKEVGASDQAPGAAYQEVRNGRQLTGYIFQTRDFAGRVYGYGGPIGLILFVEPDGTLIDFRFTQSYETPRYIRYIRGWLNALRGRRVFGPTPMNNVHAVSGATLTTRAVLRLMRTAGQRFAAKVLAQDSRQTQDDPITLVRTHKGLVLFVAGLFLAFAAIFHGKLWGRMAVLIYTTGTFGFWLNKQYSTEHVMRLLAWDHVLSGTPESLALLMGVPILILLFGNLYCGYLCPFGALQELLGFLIPKRFKPKLSHTTVQGTRFIKYAVLFALVIGVFALKNKEGLLIDPLTSVFNRQLWPALFLTPLWLCLGVGCLFVTRFWCRFMCPTGAFLSLLNRCAWLNRLLPAKKYGRCEFDLTGRDQLDCIHCDRCHYTSRLIPERKEAITREKPGLISRIFLIWLLITTSLLIWPLLHKNADLPAQTDPTQSMQSTP